MKKIVATEKAPGAIGPYSQAVEAGNIIYVSGQLPINPASGQFAGETIEEQTRQSLTNMKNILESSGYSVDGVVKTTVFLKDIADFAAMNGVYAQFFAKDCPARSAFQVANLPKDAKIEIEAIAVK